MWKIPEKFHNGNFNIIITTILCSSLLLSLVLIGQNITTPNYFQYQGALRDANYVGLANTIGDVRLGIELAGAGVASSTLIYEEIHTITTNEGGLFNLLVGTGINTDAQSTETFGDIDWSSGVYFMKVEIDIGNGFVDMGTTQFTSVPYSRQSANGEINAIDIATNALVAEADRDLIRNEATAIEYGLIAALAAAEADIEADLVAETNRAETAEQLNAQDILDNGFAISLNTADIATNGAEIIAAGNGQELIEQDVATNTTNIENFKLGVVSTYG